MDNILIACSNVKHLQRLYKDMMTSLPAAGLQVATEKNSDTVPV